MIEFIVGLLAITLGTAVTVGCILALIYTANMIIGFTLTKVKQVALTKLGLK